jgi:hypothetical protein
MVVVLLKGQEDEVDSEALCVRCNPKVPQPFMSGEIGFKSYKVDCIT